MAYPTSEAPAVAPAYVAPATQAVVEPRVLTPAEQETVDNLYMELKPQATKAARDYVLARTPPQFQEAMGMKIDADFPPPPEA